MRFFLHHFFHNETNDRSEKGLVYVPEDRSLWPKSWTTIEYKKYSLFPPIALPDSDGVLWHDILRKRRSNSESIQQNKVSLSCLSYVLQCGYGIQNREDEKRREHRTVPSGGKRYPLEIYSLLFRPIDSVKPGVYHYGIQSHVLEPVSVEHFGPETLTSFSPVPCTRMATGIICITGVFDRTVRKYGSRGYRFILLEAGHVAQNMILAGTEKGMNMVPVGGVNEETMEKQMGLNTMDERIVYVLYF